MAEKKIIYDKIERAERLRDIREKMGYTQEAFANKLDISLSAYKKIESSENGISIRILKNLYSMNISADYILFGDYKNLDDAIRIIDNISDEDKFYIFFRLLFYCIKSVNGFSKKEKEIILNTLEKVMDETDI